MGLLKSLVLLPLKGPIDGALWITGQILEAAEAEFNDPATLRKALHQLEKDLVAGKISEADYDAAETNILMRLRAKT